MFFLLYKRRNNSVHALFIASMLSSFGMLDQNHPWISRTFSMAVQHKEKCIMFFLLIGGVAICLTLVYKK